MSFRLYYLAPAALLGGIFYACGGTSDTTASGSAGGATTSNGQGAGGSTSTTTSSGGGQGTGGNTTSGGGNGGGPAPECMVPEDCPGMDGVCGTRTCDDGVCGVAGAAAKGTLCSDGDGTVCDGAGTCVPWARLSPTGAPSARFLHTAIWTGSEMIVWGGRSGPAQPLDTGARYDPATDTWTPTSMVNAPAARDSHTAIWTGSEMIIWGGFGQSGYETTGARYNPATDTWTPMSTTGQPAGRTKHAMVWTGSEVLIWGGLIGTSPQGTGGRYFPSNDSWLQIPAGGPTNRFNMAYEWATPISPNLPNGALIIFGGSNTFDWFGDGSMYDPVANSWIPMSTDGANPPQPLESSSAEYFDSGALFLFGGWDGGTYYDDAYFFEPNFQPGGYWFTIGSPGAPAARSAHVSLVPEHGLFVWGGCGGMVCSELHDDGAYWKIGGFGWTSIPSDPALTARRDPTAVWTGAEAIIWGGRDGNTALSDGARRAIPTF